MNLSVPTLIIDKEKCRQNISSMAAKAKMNHCLLRPHFKTHQSASVGQLFKAEGIEHITVSSVRMAQYFADLGFHNITIAFPVNIREMDAINHLTEKINLNLLVESTEALHYLAQHLKNPVQVFIKIDTAYHRTGILFSDTPSIDAILSAINASEKMQFLGFLTHAGHSYHASSTEEIMEIHSDTQTKMTRLKKHYQDKYPSLQISVGDTPTCSLAEDFSWADEMRPGNFVYYDLMQYQLGSCPWDNIAVAVACPVVALHPEREEVIIYGGAVHLSKDQLTISPYGTVYGWVAHPTDKGWGDPMDGVYVKKLSQEHGTLHVPKDKMHYFKIGDLAYIIPVHSCLTANLLKDDQMII